MSEYADLILLSNCIFTATEEIPFSGYIAIKNDRILSIGKGLAPTELIGTNTKYLDWEQNNYAWILRCTLLFHRLFCRICWNRLIRSYFSRRYTEFN